MNYTEIFFCRLDDIKTCTKKYSTIKLGRSMRPSKVVMLLLLTLMVSRCRKPDKPVHIIMIHK